MVFSGEYINFAIMAMSHIRRLINDDDGIFTLINILLYSDRIIIPLRGR